MVKGLNPTMLYGFVYRRTATSRLGESDPVGDLAVAIEGDEKRLELKTNASGYFETFDLSPGKYRVRTGVTGKLRGAEEQTVEVMSGRVISVRFQTTTMGGISGRVIDQQGQPVREIDVVLQIANRNMQAGSIGLYETTREDGSFTFAEVPAGGYFLVVNIERRRSLYAAPFQTSYYPNAPSTAEAQAVSVNDGAVVELRQDFRLQDRFPTVAVNGVVVTTEGKPIAGAFVYLNQSGGVWDTARPVRTDADGRFVHQAFEGLTYRLSAHAASPTGGTIESAPVEVVAGKTPEPARLVITYPK
jgi:hypothetical protein